jgi:hypothetical protein
MALRSEHVGTVPNSAVIVYDTDAPQSGQDRPAHSVAAAIHSQPNCH